MLNQAIKLKEIDMSQIGLIVFDEVHEANSAASEYGCVLPFITKCHGPHRPRILALTASPSGANSKNIRESIRELCDKLEALPFSPLVDDNKNTDEANGVTCDYIEICKSTFERSFEVFVIETVGKLSKLHKFFSSHWDDIKASSLIVQQANTIEKILSHSEASARPSNDLALFQLTKFMKKWLQSLELMRIFGPRKVIQFIKADLEFASNRDSLSHIINDLAPLLITFQSQLDAMDAQFHDEVDSPRLSILLKKLQQHQSEDSKIIVFVERRFTAERLSRLLQEDPKVSDMNPEYVVGNSSGGLSKEKQQEIMEKFRNGKCRLIVATSVLEQGIDVAACNVVICFDGVKSIKSIIQSRGRARKKFANFIVFVSPEGRARMNYLSEMEVQMDFAITQLMHEYNSKFDEKFAEEIESFLDGDRDGALAQNDEDEEENEEEEEEDLDFDDVDETDVISFRFFNFNDQYALEDHIRSFFTSPRDRLKISRKFIVARFNVKKEIHERTKIIRVSSGF